RNAAPPIQTRSSIPKAIWRTSISTKRASRPHSPPELKGRDKDRDKDAADRDSDRVSAQPICQGKSETDDFLHCKRCHAFCPVSGIVGVVLVAGRLTLIHACGYPEMKPFRSFGPVAFFESHR